VDALPPIRLQTPPPAPATVIAYYDELAERYDSNRFGHSYGRYVDAQERRLLQRWLEPCAGGLILDLGCGTGRLLDLATHGLDASQAMVRVARCHHPGKPVFHALAQHVDRLDLTFDAIFCLHLFMHLSLDEFASVMHACFKRVRLGGTLIFDVPSVHRRQVTGFQPQGWHAATALSIEGVDRLTRPYWQRRACRGVLFFPIHRFPPRVRRFCRPWDDLIGSTVLKRWSSYLVFLLERRP